jgi:hypothetical protein
LNLRLQRQPTAFEASGGGMLKLLRNLIILRAVWRLFKRGRRV